MMNKIVRGKRFSKMFGNAMDDLKDEWENNVRVISFWWLKSFDTDISIHHNKKKKEDFYKMIY